MLGDQAAVELKRLDVAKHRAVLLEGDAVGQSTGADLH